MKKGTAGFTLVELIVVIAILGILAGIAIPVYSGYIAKAQEAADMQTLDTVKTAAVFAAMSKNAEATVSKVEISGGNKTSAPTVTVTWAAGGTSQTALGYADIKEYTADPLTFKYIASAEWDPTNGWTNIVKQS